MDWNKIERDLKYQTNNLLLINQRKEVKRSERKEERKEFQEVEQEQEEEIEEQERNLYNNKTSHSNSNLNLNSNNLIEYQNNSQFQLKFNYLINEIKELKDLFFKQNNKITILESVTDNSLLNNSKYDFLLQRFEQIENENKILIKQLGNISRENSEFLVYSKNIGGKIEWIEELVRSTSHDSVSKAAFSQFLDTCSEQLKAVYTTTELARTNTSLCMSFLDSFLIALNQLQGNNSSSSSSIMGLEYLTSLGSSSGGLETSLILSSFFRT